MAIHAAILSAAILFLATLTPTIWADDRLIGQLSGASSSFSQRLYKQFATSKSNVIYSPYSIHSALSMTSVGAAGETLREMKEVLGLTSMTDADIRTAYHNLIVELNSAQSVKLDTANAIFTNPSYRLEDAFVNLVASSYFAPASTFDLRAQNGPEAVINDFVSQRTQGMIKEVLKSGTIDASTLMILINTIFFNGTWQDTFESYRTRKQDFFQLGNAKTQVDMMHREGDMLHKRDTARKVDLVELPFKGGRFGLVLALPHETEGIGHLEASVVNAGVDDLFEGMTQKRLALAMPKFKVETSLNLKQILVKMGMGRAFSNMADFSGMSQQGSFYINDVIHKAVIEVTESGTTAAAVTAVGVRYTAVVFHPPSEPFVVDHTFMYFLRDKQTGQILFQGKFSGSFHISDVIHKAVIEVTESGTTAAAVTAIGVSITAVVFHPPSEPFLVDHPFMYFLRDKQTGQILFQGKFSG